MNTVGDLIQLALKVSGAIGQGQTASAEETQDALSLLQAMLGQWSARRWLQYATQDLSLLSTGAESYTLGPGGDFNSPWADHLEAAFVRQTQPDLPYGVDYPLQLILSRREYNRIALKTLQTIPMYVFYDKQYPTANVYFWPVPPPDWFELHLSVVVPLQSLTTLPESLSFPPAYEEALIYNLAHRLRMYYQMPADPSIVQTAAISLSSVRSSTAGIPSLMMPGDLIRGGKYNIYGDEVY